MTNSYEGEIILNNDNLMELYQFYRSQIDYKNIETIYLSDDNSKSIESEDEISSVEVNPLFSKKYEKLQDLNILTSKDYEKMLREIKRIKKKKKKIFIDLTEEEKNVPSKVLQLLNKKQNRPIKMTIKENNIRNKRIDISTHSSNLIEKVPEFFNINNCESMFLSTNNIINSNKKDLVSIVSILSYNLLSQKFLKEYKIKQGLNLSNRMKTISDQLKLISPDIICLQEVDFKALNKHIIPSMKNYSFYFAQTYGSFFSNVIGFKSEKFKAIQRENLNLKHLDIKSNKGVFKMLLEGKGNRKMRILVYNIHLPWKSQYLYHKCEILGLIAADVLQTGIKNVILAGDFNSTPNSIVLKFILDKIFIEEKLKNVLKNCIDSTNITEIYSKKSSTLNKKLNQMCDNEWDSYDEGNSIEEKPDEDQRRKIENDIQLMKTFRNFISDFIFKSAYEDYKSLLSKELVNKNIHSLSKFENKHPDFTYFTENFRNTIDYIFYSSRTFELRKLLKIPSREQVSIEGFLPSTKFPSDHLMIFAEFNLINI